MSQDTKDIVIGMAVSILLVVAGNALYFGYLYRMNKGG